jgi:peptidoglycan hydrolase-like protein with peptidoglycan-binding domain
MNPLLPVAAGVGLLLLASSSKAKAKSPATPAKGGGGSGGGGSPAPSSKRKTVGDFQERLGKAIDAHDSAELRNIASEMEANGLNDAAAGVRVTATAFDAEDAGIPVVVPPVVSPSGQPLPSGTPATPNQTRAATAQAMAADLRNTSRYKENQALVKAFQKQEALNPDGKYGPLTALALARFAIVPPRPRYWAAKTVQVDKKSYTAKMLAYAKDDPARAAEWTAASKVQSDPLG